MLVHSLILFLADILLAGGKKLVVIEKSGDEILTEFHPHMRNTNYWIIEPKNMYYNMEIIK